MSEIELLSNRLRRLENHLRWIQRTVIIGCILVAGVALMAQQLPKNGQTLGAVDATLRQSAVVEDEIRAHQITLVDQNGRERASLVADNAGSVFLIMSDTARKTRVNLSVSNEGPSLVFLDPSGQARTVLGSTTLVGSHVNENGIAESAPPSSMVFFDKKGKLLFRAP
jgi:hypothetical protein